MSRQSPSARSLAGRAVCQVLQQGRSLSQALPPLLDQAAPPERALVQELAYGALRWRLRLEALARPLLTRPFKPKDQDITCLMLVGLYQLGYTAIPTHAAVDTTVEAVRATGKRWAVPVVNAVLRAFLRRRAELEAQADAQVASRHAHPDWLIDALRADWPAAWERILVANNQRPPFAVRVNARQHTLAAYCAELTAAGMPHHPLPFTEQGLCLEQPVAVQRLPGFAAGAVSVQDGAAQLAAQLLDAAPGMRVLDACAAPGGKTAHLLERTPGLAELVAVDIDAGRVQRIEENLRRLDLHARVVCGDAGTPAAWWDGRPFERILLDAPCSATGVIRRHPDIKSLRRAEDIAMLSATQARLLDAVWPLLAPGGMLLYATCSVLRCENALQIAAFLQRRRDAREQVLTGAWGRAVDHGRQILPGADAASAAGDDSGMDGFYFAALRKCREDG
ncbi:MAG: 16S rRNA (cytosine(967)-C(5))-methyltransferase RsmB [Gammaproteobacteria bacterium]